MATITYNNTPFVRFPRNDFSTYVTEGTITGRATLTGSHVFYAEAASAPEFEDIPKFNDFSQTLLMKFGRGRIRR